MNRSIGLYEVCRPRWCPRFFSTKPATVLPVKRDSAIASAEEEYSNEPVYPPLFNPSRLGRQKWERQKWYNKIQALPTVEEKLLEISRGFFGRDERQPLCMLDGFTDRYSSLILRQNCTRTHLVHGLPLNSAGYINDLYVNAVAERVKPAILNAILGCFSDSAPLEPRSNQEIDKRSSPSIRQDKLNGQRMIDDVLRAITLVAGNEGGHHLRNCQMDLMPRCDAYWLKGGYPPDLNKQAVRKSLLKKFPDRCQPKDPVDIWFQYVGNPYLQIRSELPLPEFVERDDPLCTNICVPEFPYEPRTIGYKYEKRFATMVPGVWPSDPLRFGLLSFHTRERAVHHEHRFDKESMQEALHGLGIIASFGWLLSLAANNGFTPFNDLTYPMTTQTVITNGRQWSFYAYQLNTLALGMDFDEPVNPINGENNNVVRLQNVCWTTGECDLFASVQDDHVVGFDDAVLKTIVAFVLKRPRDEQDINFEIKPYLSDQNLPSHTDQNWAKIMKEIHSKYANKPPSTSIRETPLYEKIYKIKFKNKLE